MMGVSAQFGMDLDLDYTVIVLSNYDGGEQLVTGRIRAELSGMELPTEIQLPTDALEAFAGVYVITPGLPRGKPVVMGSNATGQTGKVVSQNSVGISVNVGGLLVDFNMQGAHYFIPRSAREFSDYGYPGVQLTFTGEGQAEITGLKFLTQLIAVKRITQP